MYYTYVMVVNERMKNMIFSHYFSELVDVIRKGCKSILKNGKIKSVFDSSSKNKEVVVFDDISKKSKE